MRSFALTHSLARNSFHSFLHSFVHTFVRNKKKHMHSLHTQHIHSLSHPFLHWFTRLTFFFHYHFIELELQSQYQCETKRMEMINNMRKLQIANCIYLIMFLKCKFDSGKSVFQCGPLKNRLHWNVQNYTTPNNLSHRMAGILLNNWHKHTKLLAHSESRDIFFANLKTAGR